jgi:arylsulfatase
VSQANVVVVLADDLGYSDIGSYGGEIPTPHLDALARTGVRMTQFYNTARCSPSRASLLTGRHPHETGVGILTEDGRPAGYPGTLSGAFPTIAEVLREAGYATCLSGKWHVSGATSAPNDSWPTRRGFDEFFGILAGADDYFHPRGLYQNERRLAPPGGDFYLTDAITDHAIAFVERSVAGSRPFFLYAAYTAPHWPLHAPEPAIARHGSTYAAGWDVLRERRHDRLRADGLIDRGAILSARDEHVPAWEAAGHHGWQARRMATYAAQVEIMDAGIGRLVDALRTAGVLGDTLLIFLSDNGGCAEDLPPPDAPHFLARQPAATPDGRPMQLGNRPEIWPGADDTFASYGREWANLSNAPFRLYKRWVHEGGIATPLVVHWPGGNLADGSIVQHPYQLTDLMPTILDAAGVSASEGAGSSMLASLRGGTWPPHPLFWEHMGNAAIRDGRWKAVREAGGAWELYDMATDRTELTDRSRAEADTLRTLIDAWTHWAADVGVIDWETIRAQGA